MENCGESSRWASPVDRDMVLYDHVTLAVASVNLRKLGELGDLEKMSPIEMRKVHEKKDEASGVNKAIRW